jgi:hypothetical protein
MTSVHPIEEKPNALPTYGNTLFRLKYNFKHKQIINF